MKPFVIMNMKAGSVSSDRLKKEVAEAFESYGIDAELRETDGSDLDRLIEEGLNSDADILVSAGGDGTLKTIAESLLGKEKALGIIPLGTINNLARNLNIPLNVKGAIRTIAEGKVQAIDVGNVNGQFFTNNAVVGMLTYAMYAAEHARKRNWADKLVRGVKLSEMLIRLLFKFPLEYFEVVSGDKVLHEKAAFIVVANNRFSFSAMDSGERDGFSSGKLMLYMPKTTRKSDLLKMLVLVLMDKLEEAEHLLILEHEDVVVNMKKDRVMVAIDGEFKPLKVPLIFRTTPSVLKVYVPKTTKDKQKTGIRKEI